MDVQRKKRHISKKRIIKYTAMGGIGMILSISLSVVIIGVILLLSYLACSTFGSRYATKYFEDITELMDTFTDFANYPSYFPDNFNFLEDENDQIQFSISSSYRYRGNRDELNLKREDFTNFTINITNNHWNTEEEWYMYRLWMMHVFNSRRVSLESMTLISQEDEYNLYFRFYESSDHKTYSYDYVSTNRTRPRYLFMFYYNNSNINTVGLFCEEIYAYTSEEARKMFEAMKTYEEMRLFLQTIDK